MLFSGRGLRQSGDKNTQMTKIRRPKNGGYCHGLNLFSCLGPASSGTGNRTGSRTGSRTAACGRLLQGSETSVCQNKCNRMYRARGHVSAPAGMHAFDLALAHNYCGAPPAWEAAAPPNRLRRSWGDRTLQPGVRGWENDYIRGFPSATHDLHDLVSKANSVTHHAEYMKFARLAGSARFPSELGPVLEKDRRAPGTMTL